MRWDIQAANVFIDDRARVHVVHGYVKKALDLGRVQVESQRAVGARAGQEVGNELGGDRHPADILAVLASVAVVRKNYGDPRGAGAPEAVQHDQQFHQVFIDRRASRLHQKDVSAAYVFFDAHRDFTVGEIRQRHLAERIAQHVGNILREPNIGPAAEDLELVVVVHGPPELNTGVPPTPAL